MAGEQNNTQPTGIPEPSIATRLPANGDPNGVRAELAGIGITYGINYTGEVMSNPSGGFRRDTIYEGLLELYVDADLDKLAGWKGLAFHTSGYQIHGRGLTANAVGNLNPLSNIEATPSTRLFDLWFEQSAFDDKIALRFGQLRVDYNGEFLSVAPGGIFLSANFGWASFTGNNLPSGGTTYPLAAPGARLKFAPNDRLTLLFGVYDDNPAGPCDGDPQVCDDDGLKFRTTDGPFVIAEAQFKYNLGKKTEGLPGYFRIGAFKDYGAFNDQRFDSVGRSLADPLSSGVPAKVQTDRCVYAILEQQIYHTAGHEDKGVTAFARIAGLPNDRNLVNFYAETGFNFSGLVPGRADDVFGIATSFSHISARASALDRDFAQAGTGTPVRDYEFMTELTYVAQIAPGWTLQPDLQYLVHTGGHIQDVNAPPGIPIENTLVLGPRSTTNY